MLKITIPTIILFFEVSQNFDFFTFFDRFGFPVAMSILLLVWFKKYIDKSDQEKTQLMKETNDYLKTLIDKLSANSCKYFEK